MLYKLVRFTGDNIMVDNRIIVSSSGEPLKDINVAEYVSLTDDIAIKVMRFWDRNKDLQSEKEVDDCTSRLLKQLRLDHPDYYKHFPLLLTALARGIYDRHSVHVFFEDVKKTDGLGSDDQQIDRTARYIAHTSAIMNQKMGKKVKKSKVRSNKKAIADRLKKDRELMKEAYTELKGSAEKSRETEDEVLSRRESEKAEYEAALIEAQDELEKMDL